MVIGDDGELGALYAFPGYWRNGLLKRLDSARKQSQVLIRIDRSLPGGMGLSGPRLLPGQLKCQPNHP